MSRNKDAVYCDTCGCSMLQDTGNEKQNVVALSFSLNADCAEKVLSPFENKTYHFCYPCILKALGVKSLQ